MAKTNPWAVRFVTHFVAHSLVEHLSQGGHLTIGEKRTVAYRLEPK